MPFLLPLIPSSRNFYAHIEYFRNRFKWPSLEFVAFLFHFNVSSCWSETRKWKFTKLNKSSGWGIKSFKWLSENTSSESLKHATGQLNMEAIWYIDQIFRFMHQDGLEMRPVNSAVSFTEIPYFSERNFLSMKNEHMMHTHDESLSIYIDPKSLIWSKICTVSEILWISD